MYSMTVYRRKKVITLNIDLLCKVIERAHESISILADVLGLSVHTFIQCIMNDSFSITDIQIIKDHYNLSSAEASKIFFKAVI